MTELTLDTDLTAQQREFLDTARASANAILGVINDILDFSKLEAGKLSLDPEEFALRECMGDVLKALALRAHAKGLELACHVGHDVPDKLVGDFDRLRQVLLNIIGNDIKFTQRGEVVLRVSLVPRPLPMGKADSGPGTSDAKEVMLRFDVRDTGIGIPAAKLGRIFEPFVQADGSTSHCYGGTGLGLSISARLAELLGGKLRAESEVGKGSTFHFTARLRVQAPTRSLLCRPPMNLQGLRTLVVDDNDTNRRILVETLTSWRMRPLEAAGGAEAMDALRQAAEVGEPFALVLLDAVMPGMDGLGVAAEIHRHPEWGQPRQLLLSSSEAPVQHERSRELGVAVCLSKPVSQPELLEAMQKAFKVEIVDDRGRSMTKCRPPRPSDVAAGQSRRLRVLLAENNPVNQRLEVLLLEKMGHEVRVVGTGTEVLAVLERQDFDLVLMDVQMPEMDGLEAVAAIRRREQGSGRRVSVVALTAYAMRGERERCLAAGMDDYLTKPVNARDLGRAIVGLFPPNLRGDDPAACFDRRTLLDRVGGQETLLREVIRLFLGEAPRLMRAVRKAAIATDAEELGRAAHSLKGTLASLSASAAAEAAARLENQARSGDLSAVCEVLEELERQVERLRNALSSEVQGSFA
jgi:CheY-like chemotaxis protein